MDEDRPARREREGMDERDRDRPDHADKQSTPDKQSRTEGKERPADDDKPEEKPKKRRVLPFVIAGVILIALVVAGVFYWLDARHYESTDDAFIDGHVSQVAPQVAGRVIRLAVQDNQRVAAGQVLVEIDPRDFQVRLDQARAQLANAQAQAAQARAMADVQQASIDQAAAQVRVSESELTQAKTDLNRYRSVNPAAITRQQLDTSSTTTRSSQARLDAARQGVASAQAQLESARAQVQAADASVETARTQVANAELQLSYTKVIAPQAGRVAKRTVELGNYISPGMALLSVVSDDIWVTANFKETQLTDMRPGQHVEIDVDAYGHDKLSAHVDSFQSGTGSYFSSLPAENATGNYIKIVQRVPVKIVLEGEVPRRELLAPGLSVTPRVTVR